MKRIIAILALGMFMSAGIIGCEASAKVDPNDDHDTSYSKKTTIERQPDGDRTVKTEIHTD